MSPCRYHVVSAVRVPVRWRPAGVASQSVEPQVRPQVPTGLWRAATNSIENMMGTVRRVCRNVKRWRNVAMALRWTAAGTMEAAKGFRRLKAYKHLPILRAALAAHQLINPKYVIQRVEHDADAA
jgi:hypothetical protein